MCLIVCLIRALHEISIYKDKKIIRMIYSIFKMFKGMSSTKLISWGRIVFIKNKQASL